MKYSFIVPVYNVEKYVDRCIESLLQQTMNDYEIVIVDDGSTDTSGDIVDKYAVQFPDKVRVFHQRNKGLGGARNTAINMANGEFYILVDSDDYIAKDMLEIVDYYLNKNKLDILMFGYSTVDWKKVIVNYPACSGAYEEYNRKQYIISQPSACFKIYKARLFRDSKITYPENIYYEDLAVSPRLAIHAQRIGVINNCLYYYYVNDGSIIHSRDTSRFMDIIPAFNHVLNDYKEKGYLDEYYSEIEWLAIQHVLYYSVRRLLLVAYEPEKIEKLVNYLNTQFPDYKSNKYIGNLKDMDGQQLDLMLQNNFEKLEKKYYRKKRCIQKIKRNIKAIICFH